MKIKYISCDGMTVKEKVVKIESYQSYYPPHKNFLICTRESGDDFEVDVRSVISITSEGGA